MTLLRHIASSHLSITCICGHTGLVAVSDLIIKHGADLHIDTVELNAVCKRCKTKGTFERFQIIFVGQSHLAMKGSDTNKENDQLEGSLEQN